MQRTTIDFGMDLGTTNSSIAVLDDIDARVIPNKGGAGITPSAVWIDKRGSVHVGQEAKLRALVEDQENADLEFKLRMGLGEEGKKVFARSGKTMLPEELSAEVLKSLKMDVRTSMGEDIFSAVITVPAAFENPQTSATQKAAQIAGLQRSPLLLEPVAASLAYGFQSKDENVYWFVYDFGGGTFDAALMRIRDGLIQVVNHDGDNFLGGKLIDWDIVTKLLIPAITQQFNLPDFQRGNARWSAPIGKMKYYAEQAKIEVCRTKEPFEIWIEGLCEDADGKEVDFAFTLTPEQVEKVSHPFIQRSLGLCRKTLEHEGLTGSNLERILMVGGTTLNPWVREAVQAELGTQVEYGIDPVTVVARGAAIFASTKPVPDREDAIALPKGTWRIQIEHEPVGNASDPDIGGCVTGPEGQSAEGYTIEFVDTKTQWRSGRITLGAEGVFMTQLHAEERRRCEFIIELCDTTGSRVPTSPERVPYTLGVIPENPPAPWTIGVGLANGEMKPYIAKGTRLPARKTMDHYTTVPLHAGSADDVIRIPLLEGEHPRATRNHGMGELHIRGSEVRRDLPSGSQIEITVLMDESQQVRVQAYVNSLDEDFEISFDPKMQHSSIDELRKEAAAQKERLEKARGEAERTDALKAKSDLARIEDEALVDHVDSLLDAAKGDPDAVAQLDRRLRELAASVDNVEDAVEWPTLLQEAEEARQEAEHAVEEYGEASDRNRLRTLKDELKRAIDAGDPDLLRRHCEDLNALQFLILDRQPGFHVARFNWLVERLQSMRDPGQAEQILAQGRRAINNNDVDALKAANRQLVGLLPQDIQQEASDPRVGTTMTRD